MVEQRKRLPNRMDETLAGAESNKPIEDKRVHYPPTLGKPKDVWSKAATVSSGGQICRHR